MNLDDIAHLRLANLQLSRPSLSSPAEIVSRLGAMQAQDYVGAKWSLGLRLWPTSDAAIEQAINDGAILRTHMLRPTWHFVSPGDIRWMLALTSPRVHATNGSMYRLLELDEPTLRRCASVMERALRGGNALTRDELKGVLETAGITVAGGRDRSGQRLAYLIMWAELEGLIASGPRRGKQFTYRLLDEGAPESHTMSRDEALVELARRYFTGHGPATAHDLARWSSLTLADVRRALAALESTLQRADVEGQSYWFAGEDMPPREPSPAAYLLSIYDEYTIGYKDRSAIGEREYGERLQAMGNALQNVIVIDGRIAGTWRREVKKATLLIELSPFRLLTEAEQAAVAAAAERCGEFFGLPIQVTNHE